MINDGVQMEIIYLTGIKHSGKSQIGRQVSEILKRQQATLFVDTDALVYSHISSAYTSIREFYRRQGKDSFMSMEHTALKTYLSTLGEISNTEGILIIATGGGACDNIELIDLMKHTGKIIYLEVREDALFKRIVVDGIPPFLESKDPKKTFHELYTERNAKYSNIADFVLQLSDSNTVKENSAVLAEYLQQILN
jgi:shikimate kinase